MPSSRSATHRAGHGSNRSAASTAKTGTSSVLEPKSWRAPVTSTISLGAGISAAAARNSSMDPNGSAVPCVNPVGTLMSGRCGASLPRQKRCPVQRSVSGQRFPATGIARLNIPSVNGHHFRAAGAAPSCRARRHHADEPLRASCASKVTASSAISVRGNSREQRVGLHRGTDAVSPLHGGPHNPRRASIASFSAAAIAS
jgi:hypothetical protein